MRSFGSVGAEVGDSRIQRVLQELGKRIFIVDLAFHIATDFLELAASERFQDHIERKLQSTEAFLFELFILIGGSCLRVYRRHFVGMQLHQRVLTEKIFESGLREHTALVNLAVRSGQTGEIDEDELNFLLGLLKPGIQFADPGQLL